MDTAALFDSKSCPVPPAQTPHSSIPGAASVIMAWPGLCPVRATGSSPYSKLCTAIAAAPLDLRTMLGTESSSFSNFDTSDIEALHDFRLMLGADSSFFGNFG